MLSSCIYVVKKGVHSIFWVRQSSVDGHLGWFYFIYATVNSRECKSLFHMLISVPWIYFQHWDSWITWQNGFQLSKEFSIMIVPTFICVNILHYLTSICYFLFWVIRHSNWSEVILHCVFYLFFSDGSWFWVLFHICWPFLFFC